MALTKRAGVRALALAALMSTVVAHQAVAGAPRTRYVDDDGHAGARGCAASRATFKRIQPAIDASATGDTIVVCPGQYRQNLHIAGDTRDGLTLRAAVRGSVLLRAPATGGVEALLSVDGVSGTRIAGLVLQAPTTAACRRVTALLRIEGSPGTRVERSRFEALGSDTIGPCGYDDAIDVLDEATAFIDEVTIRDFQVYGVLVSDPATSATVEDSSVSFLHLAEAPTGVSEDAIGLFGEDDSTVVFRRNVVRSAKTAGQSTPLLGSGILAYLITEPVVARNEVGWALWAIGVTADGGLVHHNAVHHGRPMGDENPIGYWVGGGEFTELYENTAKGYSAGILVEGANHTIHDNDFRGNAPHDCRDVTHDGGTAGTANFWTLNLGVLSSPAAICSPS